LYGGGDGKSLYYDELFVLDIKTLVWSKPTPKGDSPGKLRAHSANTIGKLVYFFGGGDPVSPRNDIYILDTVKMTWTQLKSSGTTPQARGYHTSTLMKDRNIIIYGGSNGKVCFNDVYIFDTVSNFWSKCVIENPSPRFAHAATLVGHNLFVFGGHNSKNYDNELCILNLECEFSKIEKVGQSGIVMGRKRASNNDTTSPRIFSDKPVRWETPASVTGTVPTPRGHHTSLLHDNRLYFMGGTDGKTTFDETYVLDLGTWSYLTINPNNSCAHTYVSSSTKSSSTNGTDVNRKKNK